MTAGGLFIIAFTLFMVWQEAQIGALVCTVILAIYGCYATTKELRGCADNILKRAEYDVRTYVSAIVDDKHRRRAEQELASELRPLYEARSIQEWGFRQMSYLLGLAILMKWWLGLAVVVGVVVSAPYWENFSVKNIVERLKASIRISSADNTDNGVGETDAVSAS